MVDPIPMLVSSCHVALGMGVALDMWRRYWMNCSCGPAPSGYRCRRWMGSITIVIQSSLVQIRV
jgi:hypothetical protein